MNYDPSSIVKDSSIWMNPYDNSSLEKRDAVMRVGIIKKVYQDKNNDYRYHVEVKDKTDVVEASCRLLRKAGGAFNYEDTIHRGYNYSEMAPDRTGYEARAGDVVLIAYIGGETRDGIIMGFLTHPSRKPTLKIEDGPQHKSEFNGIDIDINKDGEYKLTFKGQPTNLSSLLSAPAGQLPAPQYDEKIGGTFMKFDKTGGWELNDASAEDPQSIKMDKATGIMTLTVGKVVVSLNKKEESITSTSKSLTVTATEKITATTKDFSVAADGTVKIKSPKIAIGTDGIELFEQLLKLIEEMGKVKPISPVGPCTPLMATPEWPQILAIKSKLEQIKGSL